MEKETIDLAFKAVGMLAFLLFLYGALVIFAAAL